MEAFPIVYAMGTSVSGIVPCQQKPRRANLGVNLQVDNSHYVFFYFLIPFGGHPHSISAVHSGSRPQNM